MFNNDADKLTDPIPYFLNNELDKKGGKKTEWDEQEFIYNLTSGSGIVCHL